MFLQREEKHRERKLTKEKHILVITSQISFSLFSPQGFHSAVFTSCQYEPFAALFLFRLRLFEWQEEIDRNDFYAL